METQIEREASWYVGDPSLLYEAMSAGRSLSKEDVIHEFHVSHLDDLFFDLNDGCRILGATEKGAHPIAR